MQKDLILKRSLAEIERHLDDFILIEDKENLAACAGLRLYENHIAEIYALAIAKPYQKQGYAKQLLKQIEKNARKNKIYQLFALSKYQKKWFIHHNFYLATLKNLPLRRQKTYNHKRKPYIFIKTI